MPGDEAVLEFLLKDVARRYGVQRFRDQARTRLAAAAELAFDPGTRWTVGSSCSLGVPPPAVHVMRD
jgi:hypothetical protein